MSSSSVASIGQRRLRRRRRKIMKKTCPNDLWIYVEGQDVVDMENVSSEKLRSGGSSCTQASSLRLTSSSFILITT
ncbi:hypothetical protein ZEAMMB73_Zm00001d043142 [Zea mays]|uniref:Uncharacterized protein n=1 Tax=Zea mays TaxID=4577 RepID=A0A1D6N979_MAIZE|nr:hypothetical protein ZEAMMB73_Zm00001d043142 [Zea mays]ONM37101.1 hypothetical protein ZEAMMB73_Zm00001d043142 [Zea mays]